MKGGDVEKRFDISCSPSLFGLQTQGKICVKLAQSGKQDYWICRRKFVKSRLKMVQSEAVGTLLAIMGQLETKGCP